MISKFILGILILWVPIVASADVRNVGDTAQVQYIVLDIASNYVSGQNVNIKIKKASTGTWYDFATSSFMSSGWEIKTSTMTEDTINEFYYYTFDPPVTETDPDQYIVYITNRDPAYMDSQVVTLDYTALPGSITLSEGDIASISAGITVTDPWETVLSTTAYISGTAGGTIREVLQNTNGEKDGGTYNGIEALIRKGVK